MVNRCVNVALQVISLSNIALESGLGQMTWDDIPFIALELKLLVIESWQQETGRQGIDSHALLVDLTARTGVRAGL